MLELLKGHSAKVGIRAIIMSPTRELALQTLKFAKNMKKHTDLRTAVVLGGDSMDRQVCSTWLSPESSTRQRGFAQGVQKLLEKARAVCWKAGKLESSLRANRS